MKYWKAEVRVCIVFQADNADTAVKVGREAAKAIASTVGDDLATLAYQTELIEESIEEQINEE